MGTTGGFYRDLRPSAPRIFGFHVGTREGFIICRLTCFLLFLTCILTCISKKLSRKLEQLAPTFPSKRIFAVKQKSPKSQARSHFSGIFVVLYSVTPAYKPVPYRTAADIGFRYGQKSLLQSPHHKHDWSNCGRSAAPATLSNPLSCRKQKPA